MKVSYNWLCQFLPKHYEPNKLSEILTDTGLEVEGVEAVESVKGGLEGVIVAEVLTCDKHPNADKLKVTSVNTGSEVVQVVCGAPNVAAGQKVLLATVGTILYPEPESPLKIKVSKIRDVESHGMLCAEDELGLGSSHDGILVLRADASVGMTAAEFLELENDYEIEIGLTPNRADAMGHIGVARDIIAWQNVHDGGAEKLVLPVLQPLVRLANHPVEIHVEDTEKCPRYMAVSVDGVEVAPSPAWLQKKLRAVGLSPINNIVDVTNYVMRELGTPLHAFDAEKCGRQLVVRRAKSEEKITTLDGVERSLTDEDLLITNGEYPLAIAGVFGGRDSGVSEQTKTILLEAAFFQPVSVRKTAKSQGLSTDASFRFERGVDINMIPYALERAANLIMEVAGGKIAMDVVDIYPNPPKPAEINFRLSRCKSVIGHEIENDTIRKILTSLDFEIVSEIGDHLTLQAPLYRVDVTREIDVIEEILRIYGFNNISLPEKMNSSLTLPNHPDLERLTTAVSEVLSGYGFNEIMNNSLTTAQYYELLGGTEYPLQNAVEMLNPLSQELAVMRQTLIFQALETVAWNQNRQHPDLKIYEHGKTYRKTDNGFVENKRLLLLLTGRKAEENWSATTEAGTFYTLKAVVQNILSRLGLKQFLSESDGTSELYEDGLKFSLLKQDIGQIGWLKPSVNKHFGLRNDIFVADLDWDAIIDALKLVKVQYKELPKTFEVRRDFSLLLDTSVKFADIQRVARKTDKKLLRHIGLFDVYEGKNLPEGKKSYAVSFTFQDVEQTLKDKQIDQIMDAIRKGLESELRAELRS